MKATKMKVVPELEARWMKVLCLVVLACVRAGDASLGEKTRGGERNGGMRSLALSKRPVYERDLCGRDSASYVTDTCMCQAMPTGSKVCSYTTAGIWIGTASATKTKHRNLQPRLAHVASMQGVFSHYAGSAVNHASVFIFAPQNSTHASLNRGLQSRIAVPSVSACSVFSSSAELDSVDGRHEREKESCVITGEKRHFLALRRDSHAP